MKRRIVFVLAFILSTTTFAGGGWTQKKGNGFFSLSQRMIAGTYYANSEGIITQSPLLTAFTTNLYAEYGITDNLTGIFYSPFATALGREAGTDSLGNAFTADNAFGFGDMDFGLKYKVLDSKVKIAVSVILGVPSGNYNAGTTGTLHLGDGEFNQLGMVDFSGSFGKGFFGTAFVGFNNRTNGFSDEIHAGGELGWQKNKFTTILKVYARNSLFNEVRKDSPIPGIYSDNLEYIAISPYFMYKLTDKWGVSAEAGFATFARNIIASPSISLGVFFDLKR
jgi:hypothetical protein